MNLTVMIDGRVGIWPLDEELGCPPQQVRLGEQEEGGGAPHRTPRPPQPPCLPPHITPEIVYALDFINYMTYMYLC